MSGFNDARHLLQHAKEHLGRIRQAYEEALYDKQIKPTLLVEIKNIMENLRSALDFCAQALYDKYGAQATRQPKVYFPCAFKGQSATDFRKRVDGCIPGLSVSRPDIIAIIESFQAFSNPANDWLPLFKDLNNMNKHQSLTPQERQESNSLTIKGGTTSMTLSPGASITIDPRAFIVVGGNVVIPGGQSFSADRPPIATGKGNVTVTKCGLSHFTSPGQVSI